MLIISWRTFKPKKKKKGVVVYAIESAHNLWNNLLSARYKISSALTFLFHSCSLVPLRNNNLDGIGLVKKKEEGAEGLITECRGDFVSAESRVFFWLHAAHIFPSLNGTTPLVAGA